MSSGSKASEAVRPSCASETVCREASALGLIQIEALTFFKHISWTSCGEAIGEYSGDGVFRAAYHEMREVSMIKDAASAQEGKLCGTIAFGQLNRDGDLGHWNSFFSPFLLGVKKAGRL